MSKLIKDLGAVSAYAYAVEKGYTGTEDEFAELMYDYTDVAQTAVEAKDEAVSASASAQASATTANTKADEASASASNAQSASNSAQGAEANAETFALNAGTKATEAKQFANKAELNAQKTQSDKEAVESAKSDVLSAVDNAQNYANSAQSASQAIQNMDVEATTLEPDSDAIVEKTVDAISGAVTLTYGIPKGQVGEKGDKGDTGDSGVYIGASAPSDENVNVWIDSDGEPDDVIQIDDTLTQSGQAADAKKTGEKITGLKEDLSDISGRTVIHPTEIIEGKLVLRNGTTLPSNIWICTPYIEIDFADDIGLEITGSFNGIGGCCIFDADKNPIIGVDGNNVAEYGGTDIGALQTIIVNPVVGARYIRISARTTAYSTLTDIGVGGYTIAGLVKRVNTLEDADTEIESQIITTNKRFDAVDVSLDSLKDARLKPYVVEIKSRYCWPLNQEPSVFTSSDSRYIEDGNANNAFFKITGNAGDNFVTVVSGGNATPSDISDYEKRWSAVISYDDGVHFEPCLAWYRDDNTLGVWPALKTSITSGEIGAMWADGMHLTRRGYIGFAQAVFNANPKYCAKKTYVAKYVSGDTVPFTEFGGTMYASTYRATNYNKNGGFLFANTFDQYSKLNTGASETTGKRGISWEIERQYPTSGYAEIMLGGCGLLDPDIPAGYEIQIDLYVNGALSGQYSKNTNILETLYFDYTDANSLKIEVYQNKQAANSGNGSGFKISCIYFWEGVRNESTLFPKGAVVGQMFDSWGVFHDGASGKELSRLIDEKAGVTVPYENHSLGSQTSAWGKAWFYENLQKYHPAIGIVDFGINDAHSIPYSLPETVLGPDGKSYNNRIDIAEYVSNMQTIADEASNNGIQLICTSCPLTDAGNWYYALADNIG